MNIKMYPTNMQVLSFYIYYSVPDNMINEY